MCVQTVGKYVGMGSSNEVARVRYITQVSNWSTPIAFILLSSIVFSIVSSLIIWRQPSNLACTAEGYLLLLCLLS